MPLKNFKTRNGVDIDTYTTPVSVIQATIKTNSITTVDTIPMASFVSAEYLITITQGSKTRTSSLIMQTDGTSVDMTEFGVFETGGTISGVLVSASTSSTNAILQITITDAATTIARVKISRNLNVVYTADVPDAPTIGTATGGAEQASITFTAPFDNGGASITSYTATSSPGSITGSASSSPITVTGLTGGTAYTFTVTATNSAGVSAASAASNSVTPTTPPVEAGYFAGGYGTSSAFSKIEKILFANDSISTLATGLPGDRFASAGISNSSTAGYVAGGSSSSIVKINFAGETISSLVATIPTATGVNSSTASSNAGTAGYVMGVAGNSIQKLLFSNESVSALAQNNPYRTSTAMSNSGTAGYLAGGTNGSTSNSIINKLPYATETLSTISATLSSVRHSAGSMSNTGTAGYIAGGTSGGGVVTTVDKLLFSNETISTVTGLSAITRQSAGVSRVGVAGYIAGGHSSTALSKVDKYLFSNDSRSTLAATLSSPTYIAAGVSNSETS